MARAKRTARAEARRRYRADQGQPEAFDVDEDATPSTARAVTPSPASRSASSDTGARRSIGAAFRESFRPLDVRGDLRLLPVLIRHRAFWLPVLLTVVSTAIFAVVRPSTAGDALTLIAVFLFQYFIVTPGIGAVFIAGFLSQRAAWLIGALVGVVSAACYSFLGLAGFIPAPAGSTEAVASNVLLAAFVLSPVLGAIFASAAAWYRRFLMLSNPNRGKSRPSTNTQRRPDGRSRAAASKAGARR